MSAPTEATLAQLLGQFAVAARASTPPDVLADAASRVMDVLGNALAAAELADPGEPHNAMLRLALRRGGAPESTTWLGGHALPAPEAALVNGTLAHALDFDDTHLPSVLHPSASVVPAAVAVAEAVGATGAQLLAAVAVGNEVTVRLGMASYLPDLRNSLFFEKGLHATSICGTIGSAVAAGMLLGLDAERICSAIGISASMGAGLLEANRTGGTVKRIHCGWAAHAGIIAAYAAAEGVTGPPTVLEGRFGFFTAMLDGRYDADAVSGGLGERWEVLRTVYKPYPANHFTHPAIDCALALRAAGVDIAAIESIELGVAAAPLRTIGEPREQKIRPESPYHAKFSGPYAVATALLGGGGLGVGLDDYTGEAFRDPARLALAAKVEVVADAVCDDEFPNAFSAVLRITLAGGEVLEHRTHSSRGGPEHPLSPDDLALKFRLNATRTLAGEDATTLAKYIADLPNAESLAAIMGLVRSARPTTPGAHA